MRPTVLLAAAALLCGAAGPALAQSAPSPRDRAATTLDETPGSLSTKLSESKGVIKPSQSVDPAMGVQAPEAGKMPVIRPGETGGGTAK